MKIAILDAMTLGEDLDLSLFESLGELAIYDTTSVEEMEERTKDVDIIIVNKIRCNAETLSHAEHLRLICVAATGYDNVDIAYARERGIGVANVVGYSTNSVTQVTLAMVLSLATHLSEYGAYTKSGRYSGGRFANALTPVYHELAGKTWGIYGFGNIGHRVAAVAQALGCRVLITKRTPVSDYECVSLETLLRESDILTVHTPLTAETRASIGKTELARMKKGSILVNVARGAVLDEAAVTESVLSGHLGGFGTDVYVEEPFRTGHQYEKLYTSENVILTPHMAWGAREARERCMQEIKKNIEAFLKKEIRNRVDL